MSEGPIDRTPFDSAIIDVLPDGTFTNAQVWNDALESAANADKGGK